MEGRLGEDHSTVGVLTRLLNMLKVCIWNLIFNIIINLEFFFLTPVDFFPIYNSFYSFGFEIISLNFCSKFYAICSLLVTSIKCGDPWAGGEFSKCVLNLMKKYSSIH